MNPVRRFPANPPNGRVAQVGESIKQQVAHVPEQIASVVDERPLATVCAAFGLGLIAGAGLVALYCQTMHQPTNVESLTQRLTDAVRNAIPSQLASFRS